MEDNLELKLKKLASQDLKPKNAKFKENLLIRLKNLNIAENEPALESSNAAAKEGMRLPFLLKFKFAGVLATLFLCMVSTSVLAAAYFTIPSVKNGVNKFVGIEANGTITVTSEPQGAEVFINGQEYGKTPLLKDLPTGNYTLKLRLDGYEEFTQAFTVEKSKNTEISADLKEAEGDRYGGFLKYKNEDYGFEFYYPSYLSISENYGRDSYKNDNNSNKVDFKVNLNSDNAADSPVFSISSQFLFDPSQDIASETTGQKLFKVKLPAGHFNTGEFVQPSEIWLEGVLVGADATTEVADLKELDLSNKVDRETLDGLLTAFAGKSGNIKLYLYTKLDSESQATDAVIFNYAQTKGLARKYLIAADIKFTELTAENTAKLVNTVYHIYSFKYNSGEDEELAIYSEAFTGVSADTVSQVAPAFYFSQGNKVYAASKQEGADKADYKQVGDEQTLLSVANSSKYWVGINHRLNRLYINNAQANSANMLNKTYANVLISQVRPNYRAFRQGFSPDDKYYAYGVSWLELACDTEECIPDTLLNEDLETYKVFNGVVIVDIATGVEYFIKIDSNIDFLLDWGNDNKSVFLSHEKEGDFELWKLSLTDLQADQDNSTKVEVYKNPAVNDFVQLEMINDEKGFFRYKEGEDSKVVEIKLTDNGEIEITKELLTTTFTGHQFPVFNEKKVFFANNSEYVDVESGSIQNLDSKGSVFLVRKDHGILAISQARDSIIILNSELKEEVIFDLSQFLQGSTPTNLNFEGFGIISPD